MRTFIATMLLFVGVASSSAQTGQQAPSSKAADQPSASGVTADSSRGTTKSEINPAKEADIHRLLDLTGAKKLMDNVMASMTQTMRPLLVSSMPPGEYREKLIDLFYARFQAKADMTQLVDLAVVSYDRHFSHEEIKSLLAFYSTPTGQKTISVMPQLMDEMRQAGQKWGEKLGRDSMQEVLVEHPEIQAALEEAAKAAKRN